MTEGRKLETRRPLSQLIGFKGKITGKSHDLHGTIYGFRLRFSLESTHWIKHLFVLTLRQQMPPLLDNMLPSGNLLLSYWSHGPLEIVSFHGKTDDFPQLCNRLPDSKSTINVHVHGKIRSRWPFSSSQSVRHLPEATSQLWYVGHVTIESPQNQLEYMIKTTYDINIFMKYISITIYKYHISQLQGSNPSADLCVGRSWNAGSTEV